MSTRVSILFRVAAVLCALGLFASCQVEPLRVFKATVPPPAEKTPQQIEAERQAADLLAKGVREPKSLKPVADKLSNSLGKPKEPLVQDSPTPEQVDTAAADAIAALNAGMAKMQKQLDAQNKFLAKYAGKEIEGTGLSLFGPGMTALIIALVVLAVACPPALTLMAFAYRRLKAAASIVVTEVEAASHEPEAQKAVASIKSKIAERMQRHPQKTTLLKSIVTNLKS